MCHLLTWRCRARRAAAPTGQGKRWVASSAVPRDAIGLKEWSGNRVLPRGARSRRQGLGTESTRRGLLCRSPEDRCLQRGTEEKAGSSGFLLAFDTQLRLG
uniref:Uncharacterized protein n=1 Tax=Rangifer tarandus platyrhynchus TaxID=3082113 RepID=A0ACB0EM30_RANTA|nr:unnamed protein product [Rangifer tarandus platyrhynchus]